MQYTYECSSCKHEWEHTQPISSEAITTCPECKQETAKRLILGAPSFVLANGGCGWASEGYSRK